VAVSPRTVQGQGKSYPVKIRLNAASAGNFHTGMSCRAEIATRGTDAPAVPAVPVQAVQYEDSEARDEPAKASVYVVEEGSVRKVPVEVDVADDAWIAVKKGLAAGARIVSGPARVLRFLRDGDRVEQLAVVEDAAAAPAASAEGATAR
jgi:HlyD family secretion protein